MGGSAIVRACAVAVVVLAACNSPDSKQAVPDSKQAARARLERADAGPFSCGDCNLVLISIDTLRADHVGAYGYERDTSPNLDRFLGRTTRFARAYSGGRTTAPSHMTMFTGLHAPVHGVYMAKNVWKRETLPPALDPRVPLLAERLSAEGFDTAGWHGGGHMTAKYGFDRGFETYTKFAAYGPMHLRDVPYERARENEWRDALRWLDARKGGRFFAFLHTYAVHDPYMPPPPYDNMFGTPYDGAIKPVPLAGAVHERYWANVNKRDPRDVQRLVDLYDGALRYADAHLLAPVFSTLEKRGLLENTVVVIVSDHGEEFGEHGKLVHQQLYDEILHVPFAIYLPPSMHRGVNVPAVVDAPVSTIDLTPTLLDLLAVDYAADEMQGRSLAAVLRGEPVAVEPTYSVAIRRTGENGEPRLHEAFRRDGYKVIAHPDEPTELYSLVDDPGETRNLESTHAETLGDLESELERVRAANESFKRARKIQTKAVDHDETLVNQLRALGYVE